MFEISFSYNSEREELKKKLDKIALEHKQKKALRKVLNSISVATIITALNQIKIFAINENFEGPENIINNLEANKPFWEQIADALTTLATIANMFLKLIANICWIIANPFQALYILFNWLSINGIWMVTIFITFNIIRGLFCETQEIKDKLRQKNSTAIIIYIAVLIATLVLKAIVSS